MDISIYNSIGIPELILINKSIIIKETQNNIEKYHKWVSEENINLDDSDLIFVSENAFNSLILQIEYDEINNPEIDEDIMNIKNKDELFDFLLEYYISSQKDSIEEYAINHEKAIAKLNANYDKLKELKGELDNE